MEVCNKCHRQLEALFDAFVKWGHFQKENWVNRGKKLRWKRRYAQRYQSKKHIFAFSPLRNIRYRERLRYNSKTETVYGDVMIGFDKMANGDRTRNRLTVVAFDNF